MLFQFLTNTGWSLGALAVGVLLGWCLARLDQWRRDVPRRRPAVIPPDVRQKAARRRAAAVAAYAEAMYADEAAAVESRLRYRAVAERALAEAGRR